MDDIIITCPICEDILFKKIETCTCGYCNISVKEDEISINLIEKEIQYVNSH